MGDEGERGRAGEDNELEFPGQRGPRRGGGEGDDDDPVSPPVVEVVDRAHYRPTHDEQENSDDRKRGPGLELPTNDIWGR